MLSLRRIAREDPLPGSKWREFRNIKAKIIIDASATICETVADDSPNQNKSMKTKTVSIVTPEEFVELWQKSDSVSAAAKAKIVTIEGLEKQHELTAVQQAFLDEEAFQCGYCTSGMIMSATSLLSKTPNPTEEQIVGAMNGNICRCGTYPRIVDAIKRAAQVAEKGAR